MENVMFPKGHAMQIETIMAFLMDKRNQSANVTTTSHHSKDLDCYVKILVGIVWYVRGEFLMHFWNVMSSMILMTLRNIGLKTFGTFQKQRADFKNALQAMFNVDQATAVDMEKYIQLAKFIVCVCVQGLQGITTSFQFSKRQSSVHWSKVYFASIIQLKDFTISQRASMKKDSFPWAKKLLQWYLDEFSR